MCLIGFALRAHPDFPFILCSNRDEFLARSALATSPSVNENTKVLCGIDTKAGGTWIGLNTQKGYFSALTNVGAAIGKLSRGLLVNHFLVKQSQELLESRNDYGGFNLIFGNIFTSNPQINYVTNGKISDKLQSEPEIITLQDGVFAIGNDLFEKEYVKVPNLQSKMKDVLGTFSKSTTSQELSIQNLRNQLAQILTDRRSQFPIMSCLSKYFSIFKRPVQPGLLFGLSLGLILSLFLFLLFGLDWKILLGMIIGLSLGFWYHMELQQTFVKLNIPFCRYGTVSQTIIISTRNGPTYYFFRKTSDKVTGTGEAGEWISFQIDPKHKAIWP